MQLSNANNNQEEKLLKDIFKKGFNISLNSKLQNIEFKKQKLGGYNVNLSIKSLPTKNVEEKFNSSNFDFIDAKLNLITSPQIATLLMNIYPKSAFIFALAKKENNEIKLNLEFKNNKLYSEGQLIK